MAEAGCWYTHLGIESGDPATLEGVGKKITLEQVEEACRLLKKHKIKVLGLFMLFNVWEEDGTLRFEDIATTQKTLDFADRLVGNGSSISSAGPSPYPILEARFTILLCGTTSSSRG